MNELMGFFSTYGMGWMQVCLLGLGVVGVSGLVIKKFVSKKKNQWRESTHSENKNIVPFSVPHATNYDSIVTEEVNNFLMPKIAIDDPKEDLENRSEEFKLDKPSVHCAVDISPEYHPTVTEFVAPDLEKSEQNPELPPVKENSKNFSFLDSFDDKSKHSEVVALSSFLTKTSTEENVSQNIPVLIKQAPAPQEKPLNSFNLELPSLAALYPPEVSSPEFPAPIDNNFVPTVKPEIDEEKFEFTKKYHVLIEEALYFDAQNNKEAALNRLEKAINLIENVRVSFYLKIAMQSYKNAVANNALPSIINQFYIIEKEKLMKEYSQKKQSDVNLEKQAPIVKKTIPRPVIASSDEPIVFKPEVPIEQLVKSTSMLPLSRPVTPWKEGAVVFLAADGSLMPYDKPEQMQKPVQAHAMQDVKESNSSLPQVPIVGQLPAQEHRVQTEAVEETFNSQPVLADDTKLVSFEEAFVTTPEKIEAEDLQAFVQEVQNKPLEEVAAPPVALTVEENEPPVVFAAFEDPVEHNPSEGFLSDPELSPVAENIQHQIENTQVQELGFVKSIGQETVNTSPEKLVYLEASIEDEFSDEETKHQFMNAFGDMFKPRKEGEMPSVIIPQNRKHTVWVNWMSTEGGKMNFKNDMIELSAVWGTKAAIEDLHQQLQALVGSDNQFSVVSVFAAK